ncbi:MAG: hypothetical protein IPN72_09095 [Saprospiraceae bacterium]|nr:hypothetical protein [Saprospiraceae bacterium]
MKNKAIRQRQEQETYFRLLCHARYHFALIYPIDVEGSTDPIGYAWTIGSSLLVHYRLPQCCKSRNDRNASDGFAKALHWSCGGLSAVLVGYAELLNLNADVLNFIISASASLFALVVGAIAFFR